MDRLCMKLYYVNIGSNDVRVCMPGMVYDIQEFRDGEAMVNGVWMPSHIFNPTEIKDMDKKEGEI